MDNANVTSLRTTLSILFIMICSSNAESCEQTQATFDTFDSPLYIIECKPDGSLLYWSGTTEQGLVYAQAWATIGSGTQATDEQQRNGRAFVLMSILNYQKGMQQRMFCNIPDLNADGGQKKLFDEVAKATIELDESEWSSVKQLFRSADSEAERLNWMVMNRLYSCRQSNRE